jgi:Beta-ketoacyl synthase, N-terminal domain
MRVYLEGIGLRGPGLDGWQSSREILAGVASYVSAPTNLNAGDMLPPAERRRAGVPIKLAMAVGQEAFQHAQRDASATATVFTSSGGDNDNVHAICEILVTAPREVSPTRFHNSVHNASAGYWGIAAQSREPSTSLCAFDASFAAGMLDAAVQAVVDNIPVALIAYDHCYPEPLNSVRHIEASFGVALVLVPQQTGRMLAALDLDFVPAHNDPTRMRDPALEKLRHGVPAARSLPLLAALARAEPAELVVDYCYDAHLKIAFTPC